MEAKDKGEKSTQTEVAFKKGQQDGYETGFADGQNYSFIANQTIQTIKDEAKKACIREVVEWGNMICPHVVGELEYHHKHTCEKCWQAKLEGWQEPSILLLKNCQTHLWTNYGLRKLQPCEVVRVDEMD